METGPSEEEIVVKTLIDIRDEVAVARDHAMCVYMAIQGCLAGRERSALSTVGYGVGESLEAIEEALDHLIRRRRRL